MVAILGRCYAVTMLSLTAVITYKCTNWPGPCVEFCSRHASIAQSNVNASLKLSRRGPRHQGAAQHAGWPGTVAPMTAKSKTILDSLIS
jgi:hypothetical protein